MNGTRTRYVRYLFSVSLGGGRLVRLPTGSTRTAILVFKESNAGFKMDSIEDHDYLFAAACQHNLNALGTIQTIES